MASPRDGKPPSSEEAAYWAWVAAKKSGDPVEISRAEARLFKKLTVYAKKILAHRFDRDERQELQDVASLAAAEGMARAANFQGRSKFTSWFYTLVRYAGNRHFQSAAKRRSNLHDQLNEELLVGELTEVDARIYLDQIRKRLGVDEVKLLDAKLEGASEREICGEFDWYYTSANDNGAKYQWQLLRTTIRKLLAGDSWPA